MFHVCFRFQSEYSPDYSKKISSLLSDSAYSFSNDCKNLVRSGDVVKAGQPIGLTGRTGRATTEHVHFETRINGQHFNPNLIFDLKERKLRKECIKCSKNGSGVIVKSQAGNNRIAQNKK